MIIPGRGLPERGQLLLLPQILFERNYFPLFVESSADLYLIFNAQSTTIKAMFATERPVASSADISILFYFKRPVNHYRV